MDTAALILAVAVLLLYLMRRRGLVTRDHARQLLHAGGLVIDVRSPAEYRGDHVVGAVNIPVDEIAEGIGVQSDDPSRPVLVYCLGGVRAGTAKRVLESSGYRSVHNLGGVRRAREIVEGGRRRA